MSMNVLTHGGTKNLTNIVTPKGFLRHRSILSIDIKNVFVDNFVFYNELYVNFKNKDRYT